MQLSRDFLKRKMDEYEMLKIEIEEKEINRKVDLGFENSLKPAIKEKIKGQIIYV